MENGSTDSNATADQTPTAQSQLEDVKYYLSYFANNGDGRYPTKSQWGNATFRKTYIQVDEGVLSKITYNPTGCDTARCASYTISMQDDSGKTISLSNASPGSY